MTYINLLLLVSVVGAAHGRPPSEHGWTGGTEEPARGEPGVAAPCSGEPYTDLRPFVGTWQEFTEVDGGERLEGTLRFEYILDGCAIRQSFVAADGGLRFETLGFVDAETGRWRETYVLSNARAATYEWVPDGAEWLQVPVDAGMRATVRLRIMEITRDAYLVIEERSSDGGTTWTPVERTRTRRVPGGGVEVAHPHVRCCASCGPPSTRSHPPPRLGHRARRIQPPGRSTPAATCTHHQFSADRTV